MQEPSPSSTNCKRKNQQSRRRERPRGDRLPSEWRQRTTNKMIANRNNKRKHRARPCRRKGGNAAAIPCKAPNAPSRTRLTKTVRYALRLWSNRANFHAGIASASSASKMACFKQNCNVRWTGRNSVRRRCYESTARTRKSWNVNIRKNFKLSRVCCCSKISCCILTKNRFKIFWRHHSHPELWVVMWGNKGRRAPKVRSIHSREYHASCSTYTATIASTVAAVAIGHFSARTDRDQVSPLPASHTAMSHPKVLITQQAVVGSVAREAILPPRTTFAAVAFPVI